MAAFIRSREIAVGERFSRLAGVALAVATLALSCSGASAQCRSANNAFLGSPCVGTAEGSDSTAVGDGAQARVQGGSAYGADAVAGPGSVAVGFGAQARGSNSVVVGNQAGRLGVPVPSGEVAIGSSAASFAPGPYSVTIGGGNFRAYAPEATGGYAIAIGGSDDPNNRGAQAFGFRSVAIGQATYTKDFGTALGWDAKADLAATAIGTNSNATALESLAVGRETIASGQFSTALGRVSLASGKDATALGGNARAEGNSSLAAGNGAVANAPNSAAFGRAATATGARATAIGYNSRAPLNDTVSVGNNTTKRRIMNVAAGVSATDAVNLAQLTAATRALAAAGASSGPTIDVGARNELTALRAALERLEALVERQTLEIADLRSEKVAATAPQ